MSDTDHLAAQTRCLRHVAVRLTGSHNGIVLCVNRSDGRIMHAIATASPDAPASLGDGLFLGYDGAHFVNETLWGHAEGAEALQAVREWWDALVSSEDGDVLTSTDELQVTRRHRSGYGVPMRLLPLCVEFSGSRSDAAVFLFETPRVAEPLQRPPQTTAADEEEKVLAYVHRLSEVLNLGVWEFNFKTNCAWWSPKLYDLFCREPELGPMGQPEFGAAVHPEDAERYAAYVDETLTTGRCLIQALRLRRMDGTWWNSMAHSYVEREADGTPTLMWGIFFDDTARAERENAVQQQREKTLVAERVAAEQQLFISYVFHEVRNPLNVVSLGLESLADIVSEAATSSTSSSSSRSGDGPGGEDLRTIMRSMSQNIQDATDMLNNMIDLTRLEDGIFSMRPERVDAVDVLRRTAQAHEAVALRKKISLTVETEKKDGERLWVHADRYRLAQTLNNLTGNALKFTPENGSLKLSVVLRTQTELLRERAKATWFGGPRPGKRGRSSSGSGGQDPDAAAAAATAAAAAGAAAAAAGGSTADEELRTKRPAAVEEAVESVYLSMPGTRDSSRAAALRDSNRRFVVLGIKDNGCGIAPADVASLFKPFKQISALEKQNGKGAGLGLAISRRIVELHHGWVLVQSTPGAGSEFCVVLPFDDGLNKESLKRPMALRQCSTTSSSSGMSSHSSASDTQRAASSGSDAAKGSTGAAAGAAATGTAGADESVEPQRKHPRLQQQPPRWRRHRPRPEAAAAAAAAGDDSSKPLQDLDIVLVEDDPIVMRMLSHRLHKMGACSVKEYPNGQAFLDALMEGSIADRSVVLLDDVMPVLSGSDTLEALQRESKYRERLGNGRVVVCSGNASIADMRRFTDAGAHGFLAKPITMPKLLAAIDELFEN